MKVSDMARMQNFDVQRMLGTTGNSKTSSSNTASKSQMFDSRFNSVDTSFSAPNWNQIPTKTSPKMSDEEFEQAIKNLAYEEASKGILAGTDAQRQLYREYVSVVSPDRKAVYQESMSATGGKMNSTYSFFDKSGSKLMHFNKSSNMWFWQGTSAENERAAKFQEIYSVAYQEYEAQHGKVPENPKVTKFNAYG